MTKPYVKYISETQVTPAPVNYTTPDGALILNFNKDTITMLQYDFKPLTEVERPTTGRKYEITYKESMKSIKEILTYLETEEEYQTRLTNERKTAFESSFLTLDTNKNYRLQPKGYANAQQSIDTVNGIVNVEGSLTEEIATMVLFYETPDFTKEEECTEEWLVAHQYSADPMTKEEWDVFYKDFTSKYAQKMYQQALLEQAQ